MNEKKLKTYVLEGKTYQFNYQEFSRLCTNMSKAQKVGKTSTSFLMRLSGELDTPTGTIKGWMYGNSGPESLEKIIEIAKCMHQSNYLSLLSAKEEEVIMLENKNTNIDERTKDAVVELYSRFAEAIEQYRNSGAYKVSTGKNSFELADEMEEMCTFICKNRVYFKREVITNLAALYENITSDMLESSDTAYEEWLGDRTNNSENYNLYLNEITDQYYDTLDNILIDYLP